VTIIIRRVREKLLARSRPNIEMPNVSPRIRAREWPRWGGGRPLAFCGTGTDVMAAKEGRGADAALLFSCSSGFSHAR
jgi:hypothetical protein